MDRRLLAGRVFVLACGIAACPASSWAGNDPDSWIYFDSRETPTGPTLRLTAAGGATSDVAASADTVLISYLADRPFGGLPRLSVSANDTNRVLLRFDLPAGEPPGHAELSLVAHPSERPPSEGFSVAVHVVTGAWEEADAKWAAAPAFEEKAAATVVVPPAGGTVRVDLTEPARRASATADRRLSLLLSASDPAGGGTPASDSTLARDLVAALPFEPDVATALGKAAAQHRPVLAAVRAAFDDAAESFPETTLLACALVDPDVAALIRARFVPVRVRYDPASHLAERGGPRDALAPLGTSAREVRAPALVVSNAQGKTVARLAAIGAYEAGLVRRFLTAALDKAGASRVPSDPWEALAAGHDEAAKTAFSARKDDEAAYGLARVAALSGDDEPADAHARRAAEGGGPRAAEARVEEGLAAWRRGRTDDARGLLEAAAAAPSPRRDEARYALAVLRDAAGEAAPAREAWQALSRDAPTSPWGLKARAHLAWPARMREFEARVPSRAASPLSGSTETKVAREAAPAAVAKAVAWLVAHQAQDGSWRSPQGETTTQAGITSLAAAALRRWKGDVPAADREGVAKALERADAWLETYERDADPASANSFGAAYLLDYALDVVADGGPKPFAEKAVRLLLGGQCPDGGWSYDFRFGTTWKGGFAGWPATEKGRVHSMNTGLSLWALARARDGGFAVDVSALERGRKALLSMRSKPGVFTYTFPVPRNFETADASIARAPLCEHALLLLGAGKPADLRLAVDAFLEGRARLRDMAKLTPSWLPPGWSSYFPCFAYLHGAHAIRALEHEKARATLGKLQDDLLSCVEADGTWVDYEETGKAYATAAALLVLDEARR